MTPLLTIFQQTNETSKSKQAALWLDSFSGKARFCFSQCAMHKAAGRNWVAKHSAKSLQGSQKEHRSENPMTVGSSADGGVLPARPFV